MSDPLHEDELPPVLFDLTEGNQLAELMDLMARLELPPDVSAQISALFLHPCHDTWTPAQSLRVAPGTILWAALLRHGGFTHDNGPRYASGTHQPEWPDQMCPTPKNILRTLRHLAKRKASKH